MSRFAAALACFAATAVSAQSLRPDQVRFRALYQELVETNTTLSAGDCTLAAERMASRLKAAGYVERDITLFSAPEHPKEGGLVAVLPGRDPAARPILLLAHIDVVEARREDWARDPFKLIEEDGFFYARGASDDKAQAAIFTDLMVLLRGEPRLRRTVKLALTCGEESDSFNGASWLTKNRRDLIDAEFALNEGGNGRVDANGKPQFLALQVSEKIYANYLLEVTNPGGHSSMPRPDNAIYELTAALARIAAHKFPVHMDEVTRAFFAETSKLAAPDMRQAMAAILRDPNDQQAERLLSRDPMYNSMLRTTCVATLIEGGHAENALPQRTRANINCRIFPGETIEGVGKRLSEIVADPRVSVTAKPSDFPLGRAAPLVPAILDPARQLGKEMYPGIPLIPSMSTGASDSIYLAAAGIPTYGVPGILYEADGGGIHGLNERIRVNSLYKGRDYIGRLVRSYAEAR